jgi:putative membrane protein
MFIFTGIASLISKYWEGFFLSLLGLVCIPIPFLISYIANKNRLQLPPQFQLASILFIFSAQYLGEFTHFYEKLWWWDTLLHGLFGVGFVIVGIYLCKTIINTNEDTTPRHFLLFIVIWAFSFTLCLGTLWEIFEFWGDYFFHTKMVDDGLKDTSVDLTIKILAALVTSIFYYLKYLKELKTKSFK